jgi:hypothetical protein
MTTTRFRWLQFSPFLRAFFTAAVPGQSDALFRLSVEISMPFINLASLEYLNVPFAETMLFEVIPEDFE